MPTEPGLKSANEILGAAMAEELRELRAELRETQERLKSLVIQAGQPGSCRGPNCGRPVYWIRHCNGRVTPYDAEGTNHFLSCVDAKTFRRPKDGKAQDSQRISD